MVQAIEMVQGRIPRSGVNDDDTIASNGGKIW